MPSSFENKKRLRFVITLGGTGRFDDMGDNQITLEGYRATADISLAGGVQRGELRAKIYGIKLSDMNAITTFAWRTGTTEPNTVLVYAIDGTTESLVFGGNIVNAYADFQSMPDVFLNLQAQAAFLDVMRAVPPRSYRGALDVASAAGEIAASMGYTLENNGVNVQLSNVYLCGTGMTQFEDLARMAGIDYILDGRVLAITPRGVPRKTLVPLISAETGLIGYPVFNGVAVNARTLYNPGIQPLGVVKIVTDVQRAAGYWEVRSMSHQLESEKANGAWFTSFKATSSDYLK